MKDIKPIEVYISKEDFEVLAPELINKDYDNFCKTILKNGFIKYLNFLSSAKDALILRKFLLDLEKSNLKNKDYLSVLEIVLFTSLIEGYFADQRYQTIESYLKTNFTNGMTKKQLKELVSKHHKINSLSAKVRNFMTQGPFLDQLYLSSCFENDPNIKGEKSQLKLLSVIISKQLLHQYKFEIKRNERKIKVLKELQQYLNGKNDKVHLSEFHDYFKTLDLNDDSLKSTELIANQLYEIRSKFLHTDQKKQRYSFFLDLNRGNIFDFSDVDFFKYFLRTLLLINNFELNVISIASKEAL